MLYTIQLKSVWSMEMEKRQNEENYCTESESGIKRHVIFPFTTRRPESHCWKTSNLETRPLISCPNSSACMIAWDSHVLSSNIPAIRPPLTNLTACPAPFAHWNPHNSNWYRCPIRGDRLLAHGLSISHYQLLQYWLKIHLTQLESRKSSQKKKSAFILPKEMVKRLIDSSGPNLQVRNSFGAWAIEVVAIAIAVNRGEAENQVVLARGSVLV